MKTSEVLRAARAKIVQGWTQGAFARDAEGRSTPWQGDEAVCWCAMGAIGCVGPDHDDIAESVLIALQRAIGPTGYTAISHFNDADGRTKDDVLAAFDRAIALAMAKEEVCERLPPVKP